MSDRRDLLRLALLLTALGSLLTLAELVWLGRLTSPVLGLDATATTLLAFGLLALRLTPAGRIQARIPPAPEDDGGGGGGVGIEPEPVLPAGGLEIDWTGFERDFWAYAAEKRAPQPLA